MSDIKVNATSLPGCIHCNQGSVRSTLELSCVALNFFLWTSTCTSRPLRSGDSAVRKSRVTPDSSGSLYGLYQSCTTFYSAFMALIILFSDLLIPSGPIIPFSPLSTPGCCLVTKSSPTLCNPKDCSLLDSTVHGISQARKLEWVAISSSRGPSKPRDGTCISCLGRWILNH